MYEKRFRVLAAAVVCVALALLSTQRLAQAEAPETVSVTFAVKVPSNPYWEDDPTELSDYVGEDTVVILIGDLVQSGVGTTSFGSGSLPCDGVEVAGTAWVSLGHGTIVNKGGPIYTTIWKMVTEWPTPSSPAPPPHYALVAHEITEIHACWAYKEGGSGSCYVQEDWNSTTDFVFVIVTGEFRVKD